MTTSEKVAKILLKLKAVTLNAKKPFRYSSGILSPVYTDCRILMSFPKERKIIRDLYIKAIKDSKTSLDVIAGTATAGIPHAAWIAEKLNLPMIYVRGKAKDHGKGNQIEGQIKRGETAVVIEDLISTAESSVETARTIKKSGAKVRLVFSIMTYKMQKASDNLKNNQLKLIALTDIDALTQQAIKLKFITEKEKGMILEWTRDPALWGKKMGFEK